MGTISNQIRGSKIPQRRDGALGSTSGLRGVYAEKKMTRASEKWQEMTIKSKFGQGNKASS